MNLGEKVGAAKSLILRCLEAYKRPSVLSSFGKDSMVMLSLIESVAKMPPIVFHREPFFPEKYAFANSVILEKGYTVYDWAPAGTAIMKDNDHMEVMNAYPIGPNSFNELPTGIVEPKEGESYLCGYEDLYNKPTGTFAYPWDLAFMGHKSTDVDPLRGPLPLMADVATNEGAPDIAFPIRYFTDEDIWRYTELEGLPVHESRYNRADGYREHADKTHNPDYHPACVRCMDPDAPRAVFCPKMQTEIINRSPQLRFVDPQRIYRYVDRPDKVAV